MDCPFNIIVIHIINVGKHQRVVSFSFYGELTSFYYQGIRKNVDSLEVSIKETIENNLKCFEVSAFQMLEYDDESLLVIFDQTLEELEQS
jgi:hypothetical protein